MTKKIGKRVYRPATAAEQERHMRIRERVQEELPDIEKRARQKLTGHGCMEQNCFRIFRARVNDRHHADDQREES